MFQSSSLTLSICHRCKCSEPPSSEEKRAHQEDRKGTLNWRVWCLNQLVEEKPLKSVRVMTFVSWSAANVSPAKQDLRCMAAKCTSDISVTCWWGRGVVGVQTDHNLPLPVSCSPVLRTSASLCLPSPALYFVAPGLKVIRRIWIQVVLKLCHNLSFLYNLWPCII